MLRIRGNASKTFERRWVGAFEKSPLQFTLGQCRVKQISSHAQFLLIMRKAIYFGTAEGRPAMEQYTGCAGP